MPPTLELVITPPPDVSPADLDRVDALRGAFVRGMARATPQAAIDYWFRRVGAQSGGGDAPVAACRLDGAGFRLCADPVHLRIEGDMVAMDAQAVADLSAAEATALVAPLNAHFAQDGLAFEVASTLEWVVRFATAPDVRTTPLAMANRRSIELHLPAGPDARSLKRIGNEAQMLLHEHPVNEARQQRGAAPVNGVWLWGGGGAPAVARLSQPLHVASAHSHVRGLAGMAGAGSSPLPQDSAALDALVAAHATGAAALAFDIAPLEADAPDWPAWLEAQWLTPLHALAARHDATLALTCVFPEVTLVAGGARPGPFAFLRRHGIVACLGGMTASAGRP